MSRDTYDAFQPRERERFGDNEHRDERPRREDDGDEYVALTLYRHGKTDGAFRLSINGMPGHALWCPRSVMIEPREHTPCRPHGVAVEQALYLIRKWKARELGWIRSEDERQGELL